METFKDSAANVLYHVVYLEPSGFAIVSGDDLVEPIIAFASRGLFNPSLDNPLGALVSGDVPGRVAHARALRTTALAGPFLTARNKWRQLEQISTGGPGQPLSAESLASVSDTRVAPLVQTLWNQGTANNGKACYNYYTPPYAPGTTSNYVCGCVATAMAQLLDYFQYPTGRVGTNSFAISINGKNTTARLLGGNGAGGPYSWTNMPRNPASPTVAQCQAIGALTHDCAVAANMGFAQSGSGASDFTARMSLLQTFMYSNAIYGQNSNSALFGPAMLSMVNPNLDARLPVPFSISSGSSGHEVVCDGYGYSLSTLYHHINMGWGGEADAWYALPIIDGFTNLNACIYNVYTNGSGEIISGRVMSGNAPVPNAGVTAIRFGGATYAATTDTNGIYALVHVPSASQYALVVTKTNFNTASTNVSTGTSSDSSVSSGNVWGANFALLPGPAVPGAPLVMIVASAGTGGRISPNGVMSVRQGGNQAFTAAPNANYVLNGWLLDGNSVQEGGASYTLYNIQTNHSVQATFTYVPPQYTVTASAGAGGAISPSGSISENAGTNQAFTATPKANYAVNRWLLDGNAVQTGGAGYTLYNIQTNHSVQVTFTYLPGRYTITASAGAGGAISPNGSISENPGNNQTFTAAPNANYVLNRWLLDGNAVQTGGASYTLYNIQANHALQVTFTYVPPQYTITASAGVGGAISPNGIISESVGTLQIFTATPNANYVVNRWLLDGNTVETGGTGYALYNIQASHTVQVTFISYEVNLAPVQLRVRLAQGRPHLTWNSVPGCRYQVQYRQPVAGSPWQTIGADLVATNTTLDFTDAMSSAPGRFYRVRLGGGNR